MPAQYFSRTLAANGQDFLHFQGTYFEIVSCTSDVFVTIDDGSEFDMKAGIALQREVGNPFDKIGIHDKSGSTNNVVVYIAGGDDISIVDNRTTILNPVQVYGPNTIDTPAQISVTSAAMQIAAADSTKTLRIIQNNDTTNNLWVGDSNVAVNHGILLVPGASLTLPSGSVLWGCSSGTSTKCNILEG